MHKLAIVIYVGGLGSNYEDMSPVVNSIRKNVGGKYDLVLLYQRELKIPKIIMDEYYQMFDKVIGVREGFNYTVEYRNKDVVNVGSSINKMYADTLTDYDRVLLLPSVCIVEPGVRDFLYRPDKLIDQQPEAIFGVFNNFYKYRIGDKTYQQDDIFPFMTHMTEGWKSKRTSINLSSVFYFNSGVLYFKPTGLKYKKLREIRHVKQDTLSTKTIDPVGRLLLTLENWYCLPDIFYCSKPYVNTVYNNKGFEVLKSRKTWTHDLKPCTEPTYKKEQVPVIYKYGNKRDFKTLDSWLSYC